MSVQDYFFDISQELIRKSNRVKTGFSTHHLSAGENREDILANFLSNHLPGKFGVDTGLILSSDGEFSNQADLVIVDNDNNSPLYPNSTNKLWLVESIYALIEVKTNLTPDNLKDAFEKCKKFKKLKREFQTVPSLPKVSESLFILWSFNGPSSKTIKKNILKLLKDIPVDEQPDFIIIPDKILISAGGFRRISKFGMPGSPHRKQIHDKYPDKNYLDLFESVAFMELNENSLFSWLIWLTSWLKSAGVRSAPLESYLNKSEIIGKLV